MRVVLIFTMFLLFSACDPMDDRLIFQNNTDNNLIVRFCFIEDGEIYGARAGMRPVIKAERKVIGIIGNWEAVFNESKSDELYVIIFDEYNLLVDSKEQSSKAKSDSLIRIGEYRYKTYSYEDLDSRDWKITYPDNGFDIGIPIGND